MIVIPFEPSEDEERLNRDPTLRHATLDHGRLILGQGRVAGAEQEVIQIGVLMSGLNIDFRFVHFRRIVLPIRPDALNKLNSSLS